MQSTYCMLATEFKYIKWNGLKCKSLRFPQVFLFSPHVIIQIFILWTLKRKVKKVCDLIVTPQSPWSSRKRWDVGLQSERCGFKYLLCHFPNQLTSFSSVSLGIEKVILILPELKQGCGWKAIQLSHWNITEAQKMFFLSLFFKIFGYVYLLNQSIN